MLSYDLRKPLGGQGRVEGRSPERIHEATGLEHGERARDGGRRLAGSVDKLLVTDVDQALSRILFDLRAASSVLDESAIMESYLWSRAQSIFGGTQQVQRNIVAGRLLGMPRS